MRGLAAEPTASSSKDVLRRLGARGVPLLIAHGGHDELFDAGQAGALAEAHGAATPLLLPSAHNDCPRDAIEAAAVRLVDGLARR